MLVCCAERVTRFFVQGINVSRFLPYRMCGVDTKERYLEILCFRQFYKHFVFVEDEGGNRSKRIEKYFEVLVVVDVGGAGIKKIVIFESSYIF